MATKMRAKMRITNVGKQFVGYEMLQFNAVARSSSYPADGSDEDNTYASFTPNGEIKLTIANRALLGQFEEGEVYYVDFTPVPAGK